ncbi:MAG: GNAT family N-acetyltransferase [Rhizobiales bacterium]|nr:GNAT family N-acetyltransferase [Hyphomicrobiales bacterium]
MAICEIDWAPVPLATWEDYFRSIRRSTLLQHYPYALANRAANQIGARHGIVKIDGCEAGLVQLAEVGVIKNLVHAISLDRGPLWFAGFGTPDHLAAFFRALAQEFPRRIGRKIRLLPEVVDNKDNRATITTSGYVRKSNFEGYQTIWLDLTGTVETLRAGLNGKWRNVLSKSERSSLIVTDDWTGASSAPFMKAYETDRLEKSYSGPPIKLLTALLQSMVPRQEAVIWNATQDGQVVAGILILLHGTSATYQIGWTSAGGRKLGAHHQLLWQAIVQLKARGITDFDLGGVNDEGAAGVRKFKQGLGGQQVKLAGFFN